MLIALLALPALAGDLWMHIDHVDADGTRLALQLPANWLATEGAAKVDTPDGEVDLVAVATDLRSRRIGAEQTVTLDNDGDPLALRLVHRKAGGKSATALSLKVSGPDGNGLDLDLPLSGGAMTLGLAQDQLTGAIDIDGLDLDMGGPLLEQLSTAPPFVLLEATGPDGGIRIATK